MKWKNAFGVICDRKAPPVKLKGKFSNIATSPVMFYGIDLT